MQITLKQISHCFHINKLLKFQIHSFFSFKVIKLQRVWIRTKNTRESVKSRLLFKKRKILGVYNRKILNRWTVKYQNTLHILHTLKRSFISLVKNDEILSNWQKISPLKINTDKFLTSKGYISKQKNRKNTIPNKKKPTSRKVLTANHHSKYIQ